MESGYTAKNFPVKTFLTEPQGKIKKRKLEKQKRVAWNVVESGYTAKNFPVKTFLTEPQGKIKKLDVDAHDGHRDRLRLPTAPL